MLLNISPLNVSNLGLNKCFPQEKVKNVLFFPFPENARDQR